VLAKTGIKHRIVFSKEMQFGEDNFSEAMDGNVKLVSFVHTSNLSGYTFPVDKIAKIAHENGSLVMIDAAQSVPHKNIDVRKLDVDFLAFSGHKMLGPSGIGVLYGKKDLLEKLNPFLVGGDTVANTTYETHELLKPPEKFEAGLQNYAGAIGLAAAVKYLEKVGMKDIEKHEEKLNEIITEGISGIKGLKIIGPQSAKLRSGIISFTIEGINPHDIAIMLDNTAGIAIRSGAHCVHSWFNANGMPRGSARVSVYLYNTEEEVKIFIDKLQEICSKLR
jgi:cysteine desulfurase/selenocysteine lyase